MKRANAIITVAIIAGVSALAGYIAAPAHRHAAPPSVGAALAPSSPQVYTCSMHPQVRLDQPGDCPICEMPLIPAPSASDGGGAAPTLRLSEHALAMASIETVPVERRELSRQLRAVGRIEYNESSLATITPRVDGYAERLFVSITGVEIREGDHLAEVYSPELLVAQQELLIALQGGAAAPLVDVSKAKLRLLGLTDAQIADLVEHRRVTERVTLHAPISGTVIERGVVEKAAFRAGDPLYRIANLDSVWVYLEIYEFDLPWVRYGQRVRLSAEAIPGREFEGLVTFVQPLVNEATRTVRVPVHIENTDHALKPGMFVTAHIHAALSQDGRAAPTGIEGKFTCPMHPQVLADTDGECVHCHMPLEQIPMEPTAHGPEGHGEGAHAGAAAAHVAPKYSCPMKCEGEKTYDEPGRCPVCRMKLTPVVTPPERPDHSGVLAVPVSAVLDSGMRRLVYVEKSRGLFESREVVLGPRAGEYFPVLSGLEPGERVATRGNFLIDSQFQVTGHPSLFYPGGLRGSGGHEHGPPAAPSPSPEGATPDSTGGHNH